MKALQKVSKFLSDYTSIVVIAIAVITFFVPGMMGWVNLQLFTDPVSNRFTCQSIIIGVIMFSMGLTLTTEDFKILAQRPFDICVGAIAQYLIMPFLALGLTKLLNLPDGIALGRRSPGRESVCSAGYTTCKKKFHILLHTQIVIAFFMAGCYTKENQRCFLKEHKLLGKGKYGI